MRHSFKPHYLWRPVQALRRAAQLLQRPAVGPQEATLPWGLRIRIDPGEDIGRAIWQLGLYDLTICEALWRLVSPGDTVLDVGANIGCMTGLMALRAGPTGAVRAFEPHPQVSAVLRENVSLFLESRGAAPIAPIHVAPLALSDTAGTATLYGGDHFDHNHGLASLLAAPGPTFRVETATLDEVLGDGAAAVVKIDVEGNEPQVLRGGLKALREGRMRHIVYEAAHPPQQRELEAILGGAGYSVHALGRTFFGPVLAAPGKGASLPAYEAPSFLATRDPQTAAARFRPRGWQVLS